MSESMDERRKGLEEEYFHRKNKEAIEKMRAKMRIAEEAKSAGTSSMQCPRCGGSLAVKDVDGAELNECGKCGGLWLDSGELEKLTKRDDRGSERGFLDKLWDSWNSD